MSNLAILNLLTPDEARSMEDRMRSTLSDMRCKLVKLADDEDPAFATYMVCDAKDGSDMASGPLFLTQVAEYIYG